VNITINQKALRIDKTQLAILLGIMIEVGGELVNAKVLPLEWSVRVLLLTNVLSMILKPLVTHSPASTEIETKTGEKVVVTGAEGGATVVRDATAKSGSGIITTGMMLLLAVLTAGSVFAQTPTRLPESQTTPGLVAAPSIKVVATDGRIQYAVLGQGLQLDTSTNPWQIKATAAPSNPVLSVIRLTRDPVNGNWTFPAGPALVFVCRNGLVMSPGPDYTLTGNTVAFSQIQGSLPDDIITAVVIGPTAVAALPAPSRRDEEGTAVAGSEGGGNQSTTVAGQTTVLGPGQYNNTLARWPYRKTEAK
jgi:hypothetical protein